MINDQISLFKNKNNKNTTHQVSRLDGRHGVWLVHTYTLSGNLLTRLTGFLH